MMKEIPERDLVLDAHNLTSFLLYRLYSFYRPASVPSEIRQNFGKLETNTMDDIITFFEKFLEKIDDIATLESIQEDFRHIFFRQKHSKTGNIETIGKYLLSLLENKIVFEKSQEQVKNRIRGISNITLENTQIFLSDTNFDFDNWNELYERYILSLSAILSFPELQKYDFIAKYRSSFLPESRGKKHIFAKIEHFFEHFGVADFYKKLAKIIENVSGDEKERITSAIQEHLCRFETSDNSKYPCLQLQEKLFS